MHMLKRIHTHGRSITALGVYLWFCLAVVDIRLNLFPPAWNSHLLSTEPSAVRKVKGMGNDLISLEHKLGITLDSIRLAGAHPLFFNMGCLRRSLVLRRQLGKIGISTALTYGVRKKERTAEGDSSYRGHAWLVVSEPAPLRGQEVDASSKPCLFQELSHAGS